MGGIRPKPTFWRVPIRRTTYSGRTTISGSCLTLQISDEFHAPKIMTTKRTQCRGAEQIQAETFAIPEKIGKVTGSPINPRHNHVRQEFLQFTIIEQGDATLFKRIPSKTSLVAHSS